MKKYLKYKAKYLALQNQVGGVTDSEQVASIFAEALKKHNNASLNPEIIAYALLSEIANLRVTIEATKDNTKRQELISI